MSARAAVAGLLLLAVAGLSHAPSAGAAEPVAAAAPAPAASAAAAGPAAAFPASAPAAAAPCRPDPLPGVTLYLRGGMNSWAPDDDYAFRWACDAWRLNVDLRGRQEFKIADADWSAATSFGEAPDGQLVVGGGNAARNFDGEHTLRLEIRGDRAQLQLGPRDWAPAPRPTVDDPIIRAVRFHSREAVHKQPFGAVPAGQAVRFALRAPAGLTQATLVIERRTLTGNQDSLRYDALVRLPMRRTGAAGGEQTWEARHRFEALGVYGYWFELQAGSGRYVLHNNREPLHWTRERGTGGRGEVDLAPDQPRAIRRFRQTVYAPGFRVPAWARDAIYYQIFPDRFRNGDPSNDPVPGRDRYRDGTVETHARWLEPPFRPGSGDGSDRHYNNDFFGGDLAGIVEKLDDLKHLGVDTLYLTPIFQAPSNHKYDTADYTSIDPAFGTEADFVRLTREAARRGLRILPDTSFNHVGSDSPYFDRYAQHPGIGAFEGGRPRPDSPWAGWFRFDATQADPDRQYRHWGGPDLPEVDKSSADFRGFAFGRPDAVTRRWLDRGAAGWRMDVVPWVPDDFWQAWRRAVKQHRPDAITVAETWFDASKYLLGDMFDSTMNYVFRNAVLDYANGRPASELVAHLEHLREAYPPQALYALMNLIGSHDVARPLHALGWHAGEQDPAVIARARRRLLLAVLIQMTQPGAPMVYYGDEVGLTGGDDPYNRGTYPWPDRGGQPDLALQAEYRRLIGWRRAHPVLRHGSVQAPLHADAHVIVQLRRHGSTLALVAVNNGAELRTLSLAWPPGLARPVLRDLRSGERLRVRAGRLELSVPPVGGRVLIGR